jgi:hypothetical protein
MPGITSGSMVLPTETTNAMGNHTGQEKEHLSFFLLSTSDFLSFFINDNLELLVIAVAAVASFLFPKMGADSGADQLSDY